jgi:hypothetical protein
VCRRIPRILGAIILIVLLGFLMRPSEPSARITARFTGYGMSTNGYRVAQFAVTNGNAFPVRCRFWITPPSTTDSPSQAFFDPEYEVIPARSAFHLEGAARPRILRRPPYPRGTNLPAADWVLRINVWDARPPESVSPIRHRVSRFLIDAGLSRVGWFISPSAVSFTASDTISPPGQATE